jgi:hypothetical protein
MLHRFLRFGEQDRWGKRSSPTPQPWFDVAKFLTSTVDASQPDHGRWQTIGLDLTGPGGGQWSLTLSGDRLIAAERGICETCEEVIRLPTQVFAAITQSKQPTNPREFLVSLT